MPSAVWLSYLDGNASDTADTTHTIRDLTISNTHVEGMANCAMRIYPLQNLERITIDGLHIDSWNGLTMPAQESFFDQFTNAEGTPVHIGNQTAETLMPTAVALVVPRTVMVRCSAVCPSSSPSTASAGDAPCGWPSADCGQRRIHRSGHIA